MGQISRPMQIVLAVTMLFAVAWFVVLRPKDDSGSAPATPKPAAAAPGVKGLSGAVDKAKGAVATSEQNAKALNAASGESSSSAGAAKAAGANGAAGAVKAPAPVHGHGKVAQAANALAAHKVLAILFFNPRASDDRAVRQEFAHVSRHGGKVVTVAAPLATVAKFRAVTKQVAVTGSPTVVLFDRLGVPQSIVGFADRDELNARVDSALAGVVTAGAPTP